MPGFLARIVDVRPGEYARTIFMTLYLLLVLFAYYILKAVSQAMFLDKFDIEKLPLLFMLVAAAGGALAFLFTKVAIQFSLKTAVNGSTFILVALLTLIWWALGFNLPWMLYVFNVFVSLFSITLVSQGWLVAANIFSPREAKRLYAILGLGSVIGAAFGGSFTALVVRITGTRNLLLASAAVVVLAWLVFVAITRLKGVALEGAKGAEEEETFEFSYIVRAIRDYRHLQVIISIVLLTYMVDVLVTYQFSAEAKRAYKGDELTAFLGGFYGIWLNLVTFFFQFFLTTAVVGRFGVGGTLLVMPGSIAIASVVSFFAHGVWSTGATRLTEAATRYSFNRTGMELLYLPIPQDLKNRTKAFVDIFADRFARGLGGLILIGLTSTLHLRTRDFALVVLALTVVWILLSIRAKNEYVATVRKRLESRRLDLDSLRVNVREAGMIELLEQTARAENPRQAAYALGLLDETPGYDLDPLLQDLVAVGPVEVRAKVFEIARHRGYRALHSEALAELRTARAGDLSPAIRPAVKYALASAENPSELAERLLDHPHQNVAEQAVEALAADNEAARRVFTAEWVSENSRAIIARRRILAAIAMRFPGVGDAATLHRLILDDDPQVMAAACATAAETKDRTHLDALLRRLSGAAVRRHAIEALAAYGERIAGTLGDVLLDEKTPAPVRRQIPRVLARVPHQRSVEMLLAALELKDLSVRTAVVKGLHALREHSPGLHYGRETIQQQIHEEARYYCELYAALAPFKNQTAGTAERLLAGTVESRLRAALDRLFRLLGLRYPPREIQAAYMAISRKNKDEYTTAIEFLDNVLDRELKKILLPLLDDDAHILRAGREHFGIEAKDRKSAIRDLMRSGDAWLTACAIAAAAENGYRDLGPDIQALCQSAGSEVSLVARDALTSLAPAG